LALVAEAHHHHPRAAAYWNDEAAATAAFCRVTQLALLRHLTNKTVMGEHVLTPPGAWKKCEEFLALPEVEFLSEPPGLNEQFGDYSNLGRSSPNLWTDAYLASFAKCGRLRLVSFDLGFRMFHGLDVLIFEPLQSRPPPLDV